MSSSSSSTSSSSSSSTSTKPAWLGRTDDGSFVHPDQVDEITHLNTFQAVVGGSARGVFNPKSLAFLPEKKVADGFRPSSVLHGVLRGWKDEEDYKKRRMQYFLEHHNSRRTGTRHLLWEKYQDAAAKEDAAVAKDPRGINVVEPRLSFSDAAMPCLVEVVCVHNAEDARRIATNHIKKQPIFTPFLFQSLIATTDVDHWRRQREFFNEVFLPQMTLSKIFPRSLERAKKGPQKMEALRLKGGRYGVQVHDFFLHEAQAQLQLALFGMDEEFMEATNAPIRDAFAGRNPDENFAKDMCLNMMAKVHENPAFATASDPEVLHGDKPIFGPLSKAVMRAKDELGLNLRDQFGNMMLILFAGHDTTAHTMTWLTYELAKHPEHQATLHKEVDAFFEYLGDREMTYEDCKRLPFLTRCAMETLRLWPAVADGTHRQLLFDDYVQGPGGKEVKLPKGTYCQIPNWCRHRNKALWGPDADEFNPCREFKGNEIWGGQAFAGSNPSSERFSPFTFGPRDCLGKNFAQLEIRVIIAYLFRDFSFELSEPYKSTDLRLGVNLGTMGPLDVTPEGMAMTKERRKIHKGPKLGMHLKVKRRRPATKPMSSALRPSSRL